MLLVDTVKKAVVRDEELKLEIAVSRPVRKWLRSQVIHLEHLHRDYEVHINIILIDFIYKLFTSRGLIFSRG